MIERSPEEHPEFQLRRDGEVLLVTFTGSKLPQGVEVPLIQMIEDEGLAKLVLNFANVQILTSAPIGALIHLKKKTAAVGGASRLCHLSPDVLEILQLTHTADLFDIFDDESTALSSFSSGLTQA